MLRKKYYVEIIGKPFMFRPITRREHEGLLNNHITDYEDGICKLAVVHPEDIDWGIIEAGVPQSLSSNILYVSGFGSEEMISRIVASEVESVENVALLQIEAIVQYIFPKYSLNDMMDMTQRELFRLFAKALFIIRYHEEEKTIINLNKVSEIRDQVSQQQNVETQHKQQAKARRLKGLGNNIYGSGQI